MLSRTLLAIALGATYASSTPLVARDNNDNTPRQQANSAVSSAATGVPGGYSSGFASGSSGYSSASASGSSGSSTGTASGSSGYWETSTPSPSIAPSQAPDATVVPSGVPTGNPGTVVPPAPVTSPTPAPGSPPPPPPPAGGIGLNNTPEYVYKSDFDFQSLNLALNQEWIELDLFHYGLARFSDEEFEEVGIGAEERFLLQHMGDQEVGHGLLIQNLLQWQGARPCTYRYPFNTVREFLQFSQVLTRWGEAGVYGFLSHLNSQEAATMLLQSITVEARQQMAFRQLEGLFPMPEWHETGISQSMAWTLLAPHLVECPAENPRLEWRNFPGLNITNPSDPITVNNSTISGEDNTAALSNNRSTPLTTPGRQLNLTWEAPGQTVSYNNSYTTSTSAGAPQFVAWISQLNTTYTPLENINGNSGTTFQPGGDVWGPNTVSILNNTVFVLITDSAPYVTPFNISKLDDHIVAGPAVYTVG